MAFSVQMPALGESVTEGTVTRWLKQEGDRVEVDEPLLEVSTDKVDTEIPSPAAGVLQRIVAGEDETVEVGGELAVIGDGSESGGDVEGGDTATESAVEAPAEEEADADAPPAPPNQAAPAGSDEPTPAPRAATESTGSGIAITMPELGESVTEGTVTRWLKKVGDEIAVDEPLLEVSTDKVDTEIPSPIAGTLLEITAGEDETVEVGGQLAVIGDASAAPSAGTPSGTSPADSAPADEGPAPERRPEPPSEQDQAAEQPSSNGKVDAQAVEQADEQAERDDLPSEQPERPDVGDGGAGRAPYVTPLVRKLAAE
ncbi:MAG: 2-oxoglutarate dehydrogenase, component, dihydrolipoamide succinyltransferase, partial [Pseudonocardia sp.]|nr:2-oxoglutarate dehydrogenase, component, dihydrolipoamide succinyltransferase [Pseudonocardia sp.]